MRVRNRHGAGAGRRVNESGELTVSWVRVVVVAVIVFVAAAAVLAFLLDASEAGGAGAAAGAAAGLARAKRVPETVRRGMVTIHQAGNAPADGAAPQ